MLQRSYCDEDLVVDEPYGQRSGLFTNPKVLLKIYNTRQGRKISIGKKPIRDVDLICQYGKAQKKRKESKHLAKLH